MTISELLTEWTHFVIVFHGLGDGQGFSVYVNGDLSMTESTLSPGLTSPAAVTTSGSLVLGNTAVDSYEIGQDFSIDEIAIWNMQLNAQEIRELYESYTSSPREV